uniref:PDZ domain-containing protein n=1 Tax=Timema genevievae TaxID=629358 RepID=A0A7R9JV60_TIMGE|nr:unnamed protein product [Timema genevievae]
MSSDLMSLHIGDRILEVNGTPVKDQPIENIENLIRYTDTVLQEKVIIPNKSPSKGKLESKGKQGILVIHFYCSKACRVLIPSERKICFSRDVRFFAESGPESTSADFL